MKRKISLFFMAAALLVVGLACRAVTEGFEGMSRNVRGSGPVVTEEREVSGFSRVALASIGDLEIELGETESLTIEAEENLLPFIETDVRGGQLVIGSESGVNLNPQEPIRYLLTVVSLEEITVSGLGDVSAPQLEASDFEVEISGGGNVDIEGLTAEDLQVQISGLGDLTIGAGQVEEQEVEISGGGNYTARDLASERARVSIPGLGEATLRVSERLEAEISGGGSIYYIGSPEVDSDISGLGDIQQIDE